MEKIYMQENNQNNQQQNNQNNLSIVLSFVVAIFAVFGLVVFGFNQISYAAPDDTQGGGATKDISYEKYEVSTGKYESDRLIPLIPGTNGEIVDSEVTSESGTDNAYYINYLYSSDGTPVFCIEKLKGLPNELNSGEVQYAKQDAYTKTAVNYILNHLYNKFSDKYANYIVNQTAIWIVNGDFDANNNVLTKYSQISGYKKVSDTNNPISVDGIGAAIQQLVSEAKNAGDVACNITANKRSDKISKVTGGKYYQVGPIAVTATPANQLKSYSVSLKGVDGAFLVDSNGKNMNASNITATTKEFYVRFPVNQVSLKKKTLTISVNGVFNTNVGYVYSTGDDSVQNIVVTEVSTVEKSGGTQFDIVGAPDTGMSAAQTIYFIGLIVLLCGVGIVYANAKPVEN